MRMTGKVAACVENDKRSDAGDEDGEQQPQAVEVERQRQTEGRRPREFDEPAGIAERRRQFSSQQRRQQCRPQGQDGSTSGKPAHQPGRDRRDDEGGQYEKRVHWLRGAGSTNQ